MCNDLSLLILPLLLDGPEPVIHHKHWVYPSVVPTQSIPSPRVITHVDLNLRGIQCDHHTATACNITAAQFKYLNCVFSDLLLQVQIFPKQHHRGALYNRGMSHIFTRAFSFIYYDAVSDCVSLFYSLKTW